MIVTLSTKTQSKLYKKILSMTYLNLQCPHKPFPFLQQDDFSPKTFFLLYKFSLNSIIPNALQLYHYKKAKMPTFLDSHYKLQQLQSRLSKNQYLSNDCLPNSIDARVFKSLKTHDKIPKRSLYPSFYHWYVLMRQFSESSLEHWLEKRNADERGDNVVCEAMKVIGAEQTAEKLKTPLNSIDNKLANDIPNENASNQIQCSLFPSHSLQTSSQNPSSSFLNSFSLPKVSSHIQKKLKNQSQTPQSYIMDIKLNSEITQGYENVKKIFEAQTVKLESIKVMSGSDVGYDVRVFFVTVERVCEEVKGKVLACGNVQGIQCKKQKRNQSL